MRKDTSKDQPKIDYSKVSNRMRNWQIFECMRSSLLQSQFMNQHLSRSIEQQDRNIDRHVKDRLLQLDNMYNKCLQLQLSNTTKYLIVKLEQLIDVEQTCLDKIWPKLDSFLQTLNSLRDMVGNSLKKVFLGRNIAIDIPKINTLLQTTKKELNLIIQRNQEYFDRIKLNREEVNEIFGLMAEYCGMFAGVVQEVKGKYAGYLAGRLRKEGERDDREIQRLERELLDQ